jgi:hypothetical protein
MTRLNKIGCLTLIMVAVMILLAILADGLGWKGFW